jgi:hypothetical protein
MDLFWSISGRLLARGTEGTEMISRALLMVRTLALVPDVNCCAQMKIEWIIGPFLKMG